MADEDSGYSFSGSLSKFDPVKFWIEAKAFDYGKFEQYGFGVGPASITVLKTNSYLTDTSENTMNYNLGPGSIDGNGVFSLGASKSFLVGSVGISGDGSGTLRGTISLPFKAQEKGVNVGPTVETGFFADLNPLNFLAIYPMMALIHAQGRVDAATGRCFPASTAVAISTTQTKPIADIRRGDTVLAFDPAADLGRGALVPRRVMRLYRNTTTDWIRLRRSRGTAREVITTPGHHGSDELGGFLTTPDMTRTGSATVVRASGALRQVTAERTPFCADVAPGVGRGMWRGGGGGGGEGWLRPWGGRGGRGAGIWSEECVDEWAEGEAMGCWGCPHVDSLQIN